MALRIWDAQAATSAVEKYLELNEKRFAGVTFRKCWYSDAGQRPLWDVQGMVRTKRCIPLFKKQRHFRYQIDAAEGNVIGFDYGFQTR